MLKRIKDLFEFTCAVLYMPFMSFVHKHPLRTVIYYHGIKKEDVPYFAKQMAYLAKKCSVVEPSRIKTASVNGANILVAITFDDAFVSVLENAVPVLKERGLFAGIFVPTDNLGEHPRWAMPENSPDRNETLMSKEQIAQLDKDGFEIFSHTHSHPVLTEIEEDKLGSELVDSKRVLEEIVSHEVPAISYPHGACNTRVYEVARKAGYKLGFTIEPCVVDRSADDMRIGRFIVSPKDGIIKFGLKVRGAYEITRCLRKLKAWFFNNSKD